MATAIARAKAGEPKKHKSATWRRWALALILVAAIAGAALHFGQLRQFAQLLRQARPIWLVAAFGLQALTYLLVAGGWYLVLKAGESKLSLKRLFGLAVAKLFTDQAVPAAGISGNVLMVDRLIACGVPRGNAAAAMILSVIGYYAGFGLMGIIALVLLWLDHKASLLLAGTVSLFLVVAFAIPSLALWIRHRGRRPLPRWMARIGPLRRTMETVGETPAELLRDKALLAEVAVLNAFVLVADAATLSCCLRALGNPEPFSSAYVALIIAQIVVTLGPVPLGLGAFEGASTAMLRLLGAPFEAALAATLLLRGFTLWLPLLPGLILTRRLAKWGREGACCD
ncbi:MAG TPA: lysylphosphatidylglycerol synthase transmembrane domain-containing protein [Allosphingosinicella sp.]|nr:lysylphosphatidylglycerol synthase transmembrane domain-containing protein [Allosphingosinicella sp.]